MNMKLFSLRLSALGLLLAVLVFSGCDSVTGDVFKSIRPLPPSAVEDPQMLQDWLTTLNEVVKSSGINPPFASRLHGYTGVAFYEGLRNGYTGYASLSGQVNGFSSVPLPATGVTYDWPTVAAEATRHVMLHVFAQYTTLSSTNLAKINDLADSQIQTRRYAGASAAAIAASKSFGQSIASTLNQRADADGFLSTRATTATYVAPGYTNPSDKSLWRGEFGAQPLEPYWGTLQHWAIESGECDFGPPTPYSEDPTSAFWTEEVLPFYNAQLALTDEQKTIARFWADAPVATFTPPGHWVAITRQMMDQRSLTLIQSADLFARVGMALSDGFQEIWWTKYVYNFPRPFQVVRDLIDPAYVPLLSTPNFPEYQSGHSGGSGAASEVLSQYLGENVGFEDATHNGTTLFGELMGIRTFSSFREAALEAANSRLYGGIHWFMGNFNGVATGECAGAAVMSRVVTAPHAVAAN
jgi:hypothetical protein